MTVMMYKLKVTVTGHQVSNVIVTDMPNCRDAIASKKCGMGLTLMNNEPITIMNWFSKMHLNL